ncbi:uncharacterized protein PRCAT00004877001 [Priceomyces carsonii]|uniref:uncharacterized protein n=1 Tax=Priceomyces carsonii TaxID=28549 RepID=UPI002ED82DA4|nr:unnamed protein product [Priceomyces carsonii]
MTRTSGAGSPYETYNVESPVEGIRYEETFAISQEQLTGQNLRYPERAKTKGSRAQSGLQRKPPVDLEPIAPLEETTPYGDPDLDGGEYDSLRPSMNNLENQEKLHNEKRLFSFLFSKKVPPVTPQDERKAYPWKHENYLLRMVFFWLWPTIIKGYKRTLQPNDLFYLTDELKVESLHDIYDNHLAGYLEKEKSKYLKSHDDLTDFQWPQYCIPFALFMTFKWQYIMSCSFLALSFCCQALSPLLTRRLIDFVEYRYYGFGDTSLNRGIGYTIGSVVLIFVNGLLLNHFFHNAMVCGAQAKAILTKSLLLKSFKLSSKSKYQFPLGRITSLMTTDLSRIDLAIGFQPLVVCFPIPVIIAIVLLLTNIGVPSLAGIGLFIVSLVICVLLTRKLFLTRETVVKYTDERISLMREVLNNLKVIKFYAWEAAYKLNITKIREKEMSYLFTIKVLRNFITAYAVTLPTLSSMISFVTMWASTNMKSPGEVFSSLSLFSILAQAIMLLPIALATGADAYIGFTRCKDFLNASEYNEELESKLNAPYNYYIAGDTNSEFEFKGASVELSSLEYSKLNETIIEVKHGYFEWEAFSTEDFDNNSLWDVADKTKRNKKKNRKEAQFEIIQREISSSISSNDTMFEKTAAASNQHFQGLLDVNLNIKRGDFVIVTGIIGSGKSSLLSGLAGFMKLYKGEMDINDNLLLCSSPWIQNTTVRGNILFGKPYKEEWYRKVIFACCLEDDLRLLPARDLTEIGEKGITLSGGQKARINLARAVYANSSILLLDDVLSAVDAKVGKHIIDHLFNDLMKDHTLILATHQLSMVENADKIIFLNGDGSVEFGTVAELTSKCHQFRRLIHFNKEASGDLDEIKDNYSDVVEEIKAGDPYSSSDNEFLGRLIEDEERATNAISWGIYKKYINLGSGIFGFAAAPVFVFLVALATFTQLFTNVWLSYWMEKRFNGISSHFYIAFYVLFAFLTVIFTAIEFTMLAYMNNISAEKLNVRAVAKILHVPLSFMDVSPVGRVLNRFTKDTDSLDNEIGEQLRLFIFPLATIIGIIILCICYLPWFAIAVPFLSFGFVLVANIYHGSSREIKRLEATQRSLVYNNFNETLTGMTTIQSFKAENDFVKKNDFYINKMNEAYYLSIANQRWLSVHLDIIASSFALIICMLCITDQFNISAESTGLLLNYVIQIVGLLSLTVRSMTQVENEMNSVERLHEYAFDLPQEKDYKKTEFTPPPEWPPSGYIQFNHVSLRYRPNLPTVLKDLNFSIYPGEKVGICGRTGAGKSSIMTALYRLTELEQGSIFIDGLNIADMGLYDLRSHLSIIPQDPVLFQGSIRKNLDPFNQSNDNVLWDALRRSGVVDADTANRIRHTKYDPDNNVTYDNLHKFHLDQFVQDDGQNFSLGERQLIALARSLVRNSKILILDEATSSVDYDTDLKIQQTIAREFKTCTILCIAHRLKTILNYDRIIVMDEGKIIEKGTPRDLYHTNGTFRQMCKKANVAENDFEIGSDVY